MEENVNEGEHRCCRKDFGPLTVDFEDEMMIKKYVPPKMNIVANDDQLYTHITLYRNLETRT